jgi:hypothetical protein
MSLSLVLAVGLSCHKSRKTLLWAGLSKPGVLGANL